MTTELHPVAGVDARADAVDADRIREVLEPDEAEVIRVVSDLTRTRMWGITWLVATDRRLLVIPAARLLPVESVALADITDILEIDGVGGGRLEIVSNARDVLRFEYSAALRRHIGEAVRAIREVRHRRASTAAFQEDRRWCQNCRRLFPAWVRRHLWGVGILRAIRSRISTPASGDSSLRGQ